MQHGFQVPALLRFLGYETAQAVLGEFSTGEREELALAAAELAGDEPDAAESVDALAEHLHARELVASGGVGQAREALSVRLDADQAERVLERVSAAPALPAADADGVEPGERLAEVSAVQAARALAFLPVEHAGRALVRCSERAGSFVMALDAMGLLEHVADALRSLPGAERATLVDVVSQDDALLGARLEARLAGVDELLALDEAELAEVLQEVPVNDLALGLMTAGDALRRRCMAHLDSSRRALVAAGFGVGAPVQIREVDGARRRIARLVARMLDHREAAPAMN